MKVTYFIQDTGFIAVTDVCPKGFKGVVLIGKGPTTVGDITTVAEQAYAVETLKKLKVVSKAKVPDEWLEAFGYEAPSPKPAPQPEAAPEIEEFQDEVLILDQDGENFVAAVPFINRRVRQPSPIIPGDVLLFRKRCYDAGLVLGLVIMGLILLFCRI